jgi:hypothetical protein
MKKLIVIICFITFKISVFGFSNDRDIIFNKILKDLDSLILNSENKNETVESNYSFIINKLRSNEIKIIFDSTLSYNVRGCASSNINIKDSLKYSLSFGQFITDNYESYPTLIFGIILHEFQHLYDFSNNRELIEISKNNQIEKTYFEIDALILEALFLKTYAQGKANLSPLEKYLIKDIDKNMSGSAMIFCETDLVLLHKVDAIKDQNISFKQGLKDFVNIGKDLLETVKFSDKKFPNYCSLITYKTYIYYSRQVLHNLVYKLDHKSVTHDNINFSDYPDLDKVITKLEKIYDENKQYINYRDETISMLENYYKRK